MLKVIEIENIKGISHKRFELDILPNKPSLLVAPNGYYQLVRVVATAAFAFLAYQERENSLFLVFIGLALLFQPFEKIALGRTVWNIVDIAVALFLGWYGRGRH
jgi:hypothetical protein